MGMNSRISGYSIGPEALTNVSSVNANLIKCLALNFLMINSILGQRHEFLELDLQGKHSSDVLFKLGVVLLFEHFELLKSLV